MNDETARLCRVTMRAGVFAVKWVKKCVVKDKNDLTSTCVLSYLLRADDTVHWRVYKEGALYRTLSFCR